MSPTQTVSLRRAPATSPESGAEKSSHLAEVGWLTAMQPYGIPPLLYKRTALCSCSHLERQIGPLTFSPPPHQTKKGPVDSAQTCGSHLRGHIPRGLWSTTVPPPQGNVVARRCTRGQPGCHAIFLSHRVLHRHISEPLAGPDDRQIHPSPPGHPRAPAYNGPSCCHGL